MPYNDMLDQRIDLLGEDGARMIRSWFREWRPDLAASNRTLRQINGVQGPETEVTEIVLLPPDMCF
jgi:hypothetical protein